MPHVSRHKTEQNIFDAISSEFIKIILRLKYQKRDEAFLEEFFTKTERTMFAKRLAIIALLVKGVPVTRIQTVLKVSPSTIARTQVKLETKRFRRVEELIKKSLGLESDSGLLFGIMPSMSDKGMWKRIRGWERPD